MSVGVVIGRFQVPELSPGHKYLLEYVAARHDHLLVILGSANYVPTSKNPLPFNVRYAMLDDYLADTYKIDQYYIHQLSDSPSNDQWSLEVDEIIKKQFPNQRIVVLYGSRDSFIPHYSGKFLTEEIKTVESLSGTELRETLKVSPGTSPDFRAGIIYGQLLKFPTSFQVVDIAVVRGNQVLLGCKKTDPKHLWRFIGGFVDPQDQTLEAAAKREVGEETSNIETSNYRYIGSARIDDWRFREGSDKLLSAMFVADYLFGSPMASDDIDKLRWFDYNEQDIQSILVDTHAPLGELFIEWKANR